MTGDLISRDALKNHIIDIFNEEVKHDNKWAMGLKYSLKIIDNAPTVEERPHGEWIDPQNFGANNWCSVCGKFILHYEGFCNYCSNCGADMRGGLKNDGN